MPAVTEFAVTFSSAVAERWLDAKRLLLAWPSLFDRGLTEVDVAYRPTDGLLVAIARFEATGAGPEVESRFHFWASQAHGKSLVLSELGPAERTRLNERIEQCAVRLKSLSPRDLPEALERLALAVGPPENRRTMPRERAQLRIDLGTSEASGVTFDVSEGGLYVPSPRSPPIGDRFQLALTIPAADGGRRFEVEAKVAYARVASSPEKPAGFGIAFLSPPAELVSELARYCAQRQSRPADRRATRRHQVHLPTKIVAPSEVLRLKYGSETELSLDYVENLSAGGAFVRTTAPVPLETTVVLELELPDRRIFKAAGRVVNVKPNGVGIQFKLEPADEASLAAVIARITAGPMRALLIDDDPLMLQMLSDALRQRGFQVFTAADGRAGIHCLLDEFLALDVLVTDVVMPGMGGEALVAMIRGVGGERDLEIIALTSRPSPELRARLAVRGVREVLDKAIGPKEIARAVEDFVAARRRAAEKL